MTCARDARIFILQKIREMVSNGDTDAQVILVTHGGYLQYLTADCEDSHQYLCTSWRDCETRSYASEENFMADIDGDARLTERMESRQKRSKMYPMYGREQQPELFDR